MVTFFVTRDAVEPEFSTETKITLILFMISLNALGAQVWAQTCILFNPIKIRDTGYVLEEDKKAVKIVN